MSDTAWALYVVSSDGQDAASQRNACKKIAAKEGFRIVHEIDGVSSGKKKVRAIVEKMVYTLAGMRTRGEPIPQWLVMVRQDRLGRGLPFDMTVINMQLHGLGLRIFTQQPYGERKMNTTADQQQMFNASVLASEDNAVRIQKATDSYALRRDNGEIARNMVPYGLTLSADKTSLEPLEPEAEAVRLAFQMRIEGNGHTKIGHALLRKAPPRKYSVRAKAPEKPYSWTTATVGRLLKNRDYVAGKVIDELTFLRAQKVCLGRVNESRERKYEWPLGGTLLCGVCGKHMAGNPGGGNPNARIRYYYCNSLKHKRHAIRADVAEEVFVQGLRAIEEPLTTEDVEAMAAEDARRQIATSLSGAAITEKTKLRVDLTARRKRFLDAFASGHITDMAVLQPELDRYAREIAEVERDLAVLRDEELLRANRAKQVQEVREFAHKAANLFADPAVDEDIKRQIAHKVSELTGGIELTVAKEIRFKSPLF